MRRVLLFSLAALGGVGAFLYAWLAADVGVLYYGPTRFFPVFRTGGALFAGFAGHAGGLTEYAAAFLYRLFQFGWAGALVVVALAAAAWAATRWLTLAATGRPATLLSTLPGVIVLVLANKYVYFLATATALVLAALAAAFWLRLEVRRPLTRGILLLCLAVALYYAAGGACLLFAAFCCLGSILQGRPPWSALCAIVGVAVPLAWARWLLPVSLADAYLRLLPLHRSSDPQAWPVQVLLFLSVLLVPVGVATAGLMGLAGQGGGAEDGARSPGRFLRALPAAAYVLCAVAAVGLTRDTYVTFVLRIERGMRTEAWDDVVRMAERVPTAWVDPTISWDINLALHRSRQMLDRMFEFPQSPIRLMANTAVFDPPELQEAASLQFSDMWLEVGYANCSEWKAYQAMELFGRRPWIIRRLVLTAMLRGQTQAAEVLLASLEGDLFEGRQARRELQALRRAPGQWGGERFRLLKARLPDRDHQMPPAYETVMAEQLTQNPRNRAALEYLIAIYLLDGNLEAVALRAGQLGGAGYDRLPTHVDEALALYQARGGRALHAGVQPSQGARARLEEFTHDLSAVVAAHGDAREVLKKRFGGTYFYYLRFGSGERR